MSVSFDVIIAGRNVCEAHLVDIPSTLTPSSFTNLKPTSTNPVTQPRSLPEPKNKGAKVPQAKDLKEIHERYGALVEQGLQAVQASGAKEWCTARDVRLERTEDNDMRQWQEMFSVMKSFREGEEKVEIHLSDDGAIFMLCDLLKTRMSSALKTFTAKSSQITTIQSLVLPSC